MYFLNSKAFLGIFLTPQILWQSKMIHEIIQTKYPKKHKKTKIKMQKIRETPTKLKGDTSLNVPIKVEREVIRNSHNTSLKRWEMQ